ncbi:hypothetical protein [Ectopseudomonas oleovorans]|uniref:hypothetical protein n=1 Tax=Ectopseudomonas oleovorans TaxID=301 RepID=UPI0011C07DC0|nr:hypothetical protein [Pseudomonas oleovorans]
MNTLSIGTAHYIGSSYYAELRQVCLSESRPCPVRGEIRWQWLAGEHLPTFDLQHPKAYAKIVEMLEKAATTPAA